MAMRLTANWTTSATGRLGNGVRARQVQLGDPFPNARALVFEDLAPDLQPGSARESIYHSYTYPRVCDVLCYPGFLFDWLLIQIKR